MLEFLGGTMAKVTGINGVFCKSTGDHKKLEDWYRQNLGFELEPWGGAILKWTDDTRTHANFPFSCDSVPDPDGHKVDLWEPMLWDEQNNTV
jgi:hypothetical protein